MNFSKVNEIVEELRSDTRLYLPPLSFRRGFSSSRVEHLLNKLVSALPDEECYLEVGTLEGRTIEAAAKGNADKKLFACDPCSKYGLAPEGLSSNICFWQESWQSVLCAKGTQRFPFSIGCAFYDGLHEAEETAAFMASIEPYLSNEAVLVLDDWDRASVRKGAFSSSSRWRLLREMPEYGDGLTCPQRHFGYSFGVSIWGFQR